MKEFAKKAVPDRLFKFYGINDGTEKHLLADEITLKKASEFNDPFDSLVYSDKSKIYSEFKQYFFSQDLFFTKKISDEMMQSELDEMYPETYKMLQEYSYIMCLTPDVTSQLMWAHYADSHKGYALEYSGENLKAVCDSYDKYYNKYLLPVEYTKRRYDATCAVERVLEYRFATEHGLSYRQLDDTLELIKPLLYKSDDWKYEKEWRLILNCLVDNAAVRIDRKMTKQIKPKAIYLGCNISEQNEELFRSIALKKSIPVKKMKMNNESYEFKMEIGI